MGNYAYRQVKDYWRFAKGTWWKMWDNQVTEIEFKTERTENASNECGNIGAIREVEKKNWSWFDYGWNHWSHKKRALCWVHLKNWDTWERSKWERKILVNLIRSVDRWERKPRKVN